MEQPTNQPTSQPGRDRPQARDVVFESFDPALEVGPGGGGGGGGAAAHAGRRPRITSQVFVTANSAKLPPFGFNFSRQNSNIYILYLYFFFFN